jgi:Leucine rich repeat
MRLLLALMAFACWNPFAFAAKTDEAKERERLEKAGAQVTVDDDMPDAARLRVSFTKLDDKAAVALKGCTHVVAVTVEDASKLTDRTLVIVGTLHELRELSLFKPAITGAGIAYLKTLKGLRKLYLVDARLYDNGLAHLKDLDKLEELDLSGTAITNAAGATFKDLPALKLLAVSKTKFGDSGAAHLKELKDLKALEAVNSDLSVKGAMALEASLPGIRIKR